jgi:hypothetical protein
MRNVMFAIMLFVIAGFFVTAKPAPKKFSLCSNKRFVKMCSSECLKNSSKRVCAAMFYQARLLEKRMSNQSGFIYFSNLDKLSRLLTFYCPVSVDVAALAGMMF